jgi:hypothetical protein
MEERTSLPGWNGLTNGRQADPVSSPIAKVPNIAIPSSVHELPEITASSRNVNDKRKGDEDRMGEN